MLPRLIGSETTAAKLQEGLRSSSRAVQGIAHRVANSGNPDFAEALDAAAAGDQDAAALERDMVSLVDEQLRFEATANLLQKVYQQVRSSIRER